MDSSHRGVSDHSRGKTATPTAVAVAVTFLLLASFAGHAYGYNLTTLEFTNTSAQLRVLGVDENDRVLYWEAGKYAIFALDVETENTTIYAGSAASSGAIHGTTFGNTRFSNVQFMCAIGPSLFYVKDGSRIVELNRDTQMSLRVVASALSLQCDEPNWQFFWHYSKGAVNQVLRYEVNTSTTIVITQNKRGNNDVVPDVFEDRVLVYSSSTSKSVFLEANLSRPFQNGWYMPASGVPLPPTSPFRFMPTKGKYHYVYAAPSSGATVRCSWLRYDRTRQLEQSETNFPGRCEAVNESFQGDAMNAVHTAQSGAASNDNTRFYFAEQNTLGNYTIRYLSDFPDEHFLPLVAAPDPTPIPPLTPIPVPPATPVPTPAPTTDPGTLSLGTFGSTAQSGRTLTVLGVDPANYVFFASSNTRAIWRLNPATGVEERWAGSSTVQGHRNSASRLNALFRTPAYMCTTDFENHYLIDSGNRRVYRVQDGENYVTSVAGNGAAHYVTAAAALSTGLANPISCAVHPDSSVYIASAGSGAGAAPYATIFRLVADANFLQVVAGTLPGSVTVDTDALLTPLTGLKDIHIESGAGFLVIFTETGASGTPELLRYDPATRKISLLNPIVSTAGGNTLAWVAPTNARRWWYRFTRDTCTLYRYDTYSSYDERSLGLPGTCPGAGESAVDGIGNVTRAYDVGRAVFTRSDELLVFAETDRAGESKIRFFYGFPEDQQTLVTPAPTPAPPPATVVEAATVQSTIGSNLLRPLHVDRNGYVIFWRDGQHALWKVNPDTGDEQRWAGRSSQAGSSEAALANALLTNVVALCTGNRDTYYAVDRGAQRLLAITETLDTVAFVAGNGTLMNFSDGTALASSLPNAVDCAVHTAGSVYMTVEGDEAVSTYPMVVRYDPNAGTLTRVAGGVHGNATTFGAAMSSQFLCVSGVWQDPTSFNILVQVCGDVDGLVLVDLALETTQLRRELPAYASGTNTSLGGDVVAVSPTRQWWFRYRTGANASDFSACSWTRLDALSSFDEEILKAPNWCAQDASDAFVDGNATSMTMHRVVGTQAVFSGDGKRLYFGELGSNGQFAIRYIFFSAGPGNVDVVTPVPTLAPVPTPVPPPPTPLPTAVPTPQPTPVPVSPLQSWDSCVRAVSVFPRTYLACAVNDGVLSSWTPRSLGCLAFGGALVSE